jgi:two-component system, LytTR family, sensor kinase
MFRFRKNQLWFYHLLFWGLYAALHYLAFGQFMGVGAITIRVLLGGMLHAAFAYTNYYGLVPAYFAQKRYGLYFGLGLVLLSIGVFLRVKLDELFPPITGLFATQPSFQRLRIFIPVITFLTIWGISSLFRVLQDYFANLKISNQLKTNQLETELKFLKTQINPHFLFNTLNNIYGLVYLKSDEAGPMLLKLSGILRYMLYDSDMAKVPIQKEIDYLKDCIDLQILNPKDRPKVSFELQNNYPELRIEPLLFINFLENSFKHGSLSQQDGFIRIRLKTDEKSLSFSIANSVLPGNQSKDKVGGIGLPNIRQRLELAYPNRHELQVREGVNQHEVLLNLTY